MAKPRKKQSKASGLHPRNPHRGRYDFTALCQSSLELSTFLRPNPKGDQTIDFSDANAVRALNRALLAHFYQVRFWEIPEGYLCPPIPGRADYIHHAADLLAQCCPGGEVPRGKRVRALDIGTGANCIYPIIGSQSYGWQFVGSDIDPVSVQVASLIVSSNANLSPLIKVRHQADASCLFAGMIGKDEQFDLTFCNPPFHASQAEAEAGSQRKWRNLKGGAKKGRGAGRGRPPERSAVLNFGGQKAELWCPGGELGFLKRMIDESVQFSDQICWFTSLVSKGDNVTALKQRLSQVGARQIQVVKMAQGQKISRLIAWSFLTPEAQTEWAKRRWKN